MLKYKNYDSGFCRHYFRCQETKELYCFQEDFPDEWAFYLCSSDGEPCSIRKHFEYEFDIEIKLNVV